MSRFIPVGSRFCKAAAEHDFTLQSGAHGDRLLDRLADAVPHQVLRETGQLSTSWCSVAQGGRFRCTKSHTSVTMMCEWNSITGALRQRRSRPGPCERSPGGARIAVLMRHSPAPPDTKPCAANLSHLLRVELAEYLVPE